MQQETWIVVEDATRQTTLATAALDDGVLVCEGTYYFVQDKVKMDNLRVTDRTYTCPYKGVCYWIDLVGFDGKVLKDAAWIYPEPKPGFEHIKGRIGFYPGMRMATIVRREAAGENTVSP